MVKPSSILLSIGTIVLLFGVVISATGLRPLAMIDTSVGPINVKVDGITDDQAVILGSGIIFLAFGAYFRSKKN